MKQARLQVLLLVILALAAPGQALAQSLPPDPPDAVTVPPRSAAAPAPLPAPPSASPADVERAKQAFKAGAAAYAAGDYAAAIQALEAAYALTPLPAIAFSLAQAERRQYFVMHDARHLTRAIELFRLYLMQVPAGGRRSDATDALSQLEPILAKIDAAPASPAAPAPAKATQLIIYSDTPGAQISVDGVSRAGSPVLVQVEPGRHRVEVSAAGFKTEAREVVAVLGELIPVSMPLAPLPNLLELSTPLEADVYVNGSFASPGGQRLVLELPSGIHHVSVVQNGYRPTTRVLELGRGEYRTETLSLEPTAQRHAAYAMFIGGGAAALTGAAFSYLALRAEDSAQGFLVKRERENVSAAERVRYEADVTQRNRYRAIAGIGFGAALGMFVTGLLLHELDDPDPEDLRAPGPALRNPEPPSDASSPTRHLAWSPLLAPGEVGLTIGGAF